MTNWTKSRQKPRLRRCRRVRLTSTACSRIRRRLVAKAMESVAASGAVKEMRLQEALRETLRYEMARDRRVFVMGEDVALFGGAYGVTRGLLQEFGEERVRDTPISEAALVGLAAGAAINGMRPVVEIQFCDLLPLCMD